eukprot:gnl/TRDRNA2_/TRDRNA2_66449_c0_seq1.p1 gnl/TRDRNA2_/TRDRNA2_66449_c0~~gnl/TRDRNA2_/TRDRNA2_66449_c0_seq1.p1  ORF type:complete len:318 (-),score=33.96 gnl/TRDRNA2_/TRDRNA2_66449_c0_seq1:88-1041(-)
MHDRHALLADELLEQAVNGRRSVKALWPLCLLLGLCCIGLLSWLPGARSASGQHLAVDEAALSMALGAVSRARPSASALGRSPVGRSVRLPPHFSNSQASSIISSAVADAFAFARGTSHLLEVRAASDRAVKEMQGHWQDAQVWLLGVQNASDPSVAKLRNHPLVTSVAANSAVRGVLSWGHLSAQLRVLNVTLARLGRSLSVIKDKALSSVSKYGVAGILSLVVEQVVVWFFIILPVTSYIFHTSFGVGGGPWLPSLGDPESLAEFGKVLGGVWVGSKFPPFEAARWAWIISMVPWFQERLDSMNGQNMTQVPLIN